MKKDQGDYMAPKKSHAKKDSLSNTLALQSEPDALQLPIPTTSASPSPSRNVKPQKLPPSAAGPLLSDTPTSRSASPSKLNASKQPTKTKVNLSGGTSMRGASTALSDLDSAIRALEIQTNPSIVPSAEETARRKCNCMAQRHPLLTAAPNCLSCGNIVCVKQGLGPCTFCGQPLLRSEDLQAMIRILRDERGKEKMEANNAAHKRPEVAKTPRPFTSTTGSTPASSAANTPPDTDDEKLAAAKAHRDRLLRFQAQNAKRTSIRDEAADFSTPDDGQSLWATPAERALQLKKQQRTLREQDWNARPEWEKRQVVVSIDVKGGKAVRRMADVERPPEADLSENSDDDINDSAGPAEKGSGTGTFSRNPLAKGLIRPVFQPKGKELAGDRAERKAASWRRVQDDNDDNEQWILDGGAYGEMVDGRVLGSDEPACG